MYPPCHLHWLPPSHFLFTWVNGDYTLTRKISPSIMLLSLSYISKSYRTDVLNLNLPPYYHISLPYVMGFDIKVIHQRIKTTHSYASHCHYSNVDFVLFHNVTCYNNSLLSCIHVNTTCLLNITSTLVAIGVLLGRLECSLGHTKLDIYLVYTSFLTRLIFVDQIPLDLHNITQLMSCVNGPNGRFVNKDSGCWNSTTSNWIWS